MSLITDLNQLNHDIPLPLAMEMIARYRAQCEVILKPEFQNKEVLPYCETFQADAFARILAQPSCVGVRAYLGMDKEDKVKLIFFGVNDQYKDIIPSDSGTQSFKASTGRSPAGASATEDEGDDEGVIIEEGQRCPPLCP